MDSPRIPPHSVEAEQSVLGGLMLDGGASWDAVADVITAQDFYRPDHRLIFEAAGALIERRQPVDFLTLSEQLERTARLEQAGGNAYLATLARDTLGSANIRAYAEIVRERALLRRLIEVGNGIAGSAFDIEGGSARELVDDAERRVFEIAEAGAHGRGKLRKVGSILPEVADHIDRLYNNPNELRGVPTGYKVLDEITGGLQRGDLVIIAGRPSMGKTSLAVNIAEHASLAHNLPSAIFSMEMSQQQLLLRMVSSIGRIDQSSLRTGRLSKEDWSRIDTAMKLLGPAPVYIDDTGAMTPTELRARARRLKREQGLGLIVVDYIQLMQVQGTKENRATEISEISRSLKALARELNVPVIALSQLNRGVEQRQEKRPVMSDLRECVTGDTLVCLTDGRRVPIRELVGLQPEVWAIDDQQRLMRAHSDKVWRVGRKPVFDVKLASGRSVRATGKHRLFAGTGWTTVSQLKIGDRLALARRIPQPKKTQRWPDHWLVFLGQMAGDGSYLNNAPMRYTTASEENSTAVKLSAEAFGCRVKRYAGRGAWHQLLISGNGNRWHPAGAGRWLKEVGIFGQRSHEKRLPAAVFTLADDQIALLLRHLWATDGCISVRSTGKRGSHGVHFTSTSEGLVRDVAALLLRLGIVARIRATYSKDYRPWYTVYVSGLEAQLRFASSVGAFGPRLAPMNALIAHHAVRSANTNVDTLPEQVLQRVCSLMTQQGISRSQMAAIRGYSNINLDHAPSRPLISKYAEILQDDSLREACESDLFWDRVVAIEAAGEEEVFDLTVPGPANWLADGIVSHNSGALEQDADVILLIYREEVYEQNTPRKGIADIIIAKQRNGPTGEVSLTFLGNYTKFENYAPEAYGEGILR